MILLKVLTVLAMGFLALALLKFLSDAFNGAAARVRAKQPARRKRLVRDSRTGIYYPEQ